MVRMRRVLIIEDDEDIRGALSEVLLSERYVVTEAGDGLEGLRSARAQRPDIILLDLMMPRMDGWAFREAQRKDARLATIPIVIISACLEDQVHGLGAVAHLHKPFEVSDLLAVIGRLTAVAA